MRGISASLLLALLACATADGGTAAAASSELHHWQTTAGKPPSQAEFAAVIAACEDRAKNSGTGASIEGCLADFGLHRVE
jgi:hypothetical protein